MFAFLNCRRKWGYGFLLLVLPAWGMAYEPEPMLIAQLTDPIVECNESNCMLEGVCDWRYGHNHRMHWPQWPNHGFTGVDVDAGRYRLADDFVCTRSGPIHGIHVWGSFQNDVLPVAGPNSLSFAIFIHSKNPAQPDQPGDLLWSQTFSPGQYHVRACHDGPQGWLTLPNQHSYAQDHRIAYQYNFCIAGDSIHVEEGDVYWLAIIELRTPQAAYRWGWRTTLMDQAYQAPSVYERDSALPWFTLPDPWDEDPIPKLMDFAFVVTGKDIQKPRYDLGDAPDSSNSLGAPMVAYPWSAAIANYPTVFRAGSPPYGPLHRAPKAFACLGSNVSMENEADIGFDQDPTTNLKPVPNLADLDACDEGVLLPISMSHCEIAQIQYQVRVFNPIQSTAYVNIWCDWNRDGDWDDTLTCQDGLQAPEWAVQNQSIAITDTGIFDITSLPFTCWHLFGDITPSPIWMRVTLAERPIDPYTQNTGGAGPAGGYAYGETEDYYLYLHDEDWMSLTDYGDAPDDVLVPQYPTLSSHSGAAHRIAGPWFGPADSRPDHETEGQPHSDAQGDDLNPHFSLGPSGDDEQGVSTPPLVPGVRTDITLEVQGGGGHVSGWIDFNRDTIWQAEEKVINDYLPNGIHIIPVDVPQTAIAGSSFARFRITRQGELSPVGLAVDGEVEDHPVIIRPHDCNKVVQWPDTTPNGMALRIDTNDVDANDGILRSLADDFECSSPGPITHVRLWGVWQDDHRGQIERIRLSIQADDPVGPMGSDPSNDFSKPDPAVRWSQTFTAGTFSEQLYHEVYAPGPWWWDRKRSEVRPGEGKELWQIDIPINQAIAFQQQGTASQPVIYWLRVEMKTQDGEFGWQVRRWPDHFMDDAVGYNQQGEPKPWHELFYPQPHPYFGLEWNSLDMAFCLQHETGTPPQETSQPISPTRCPAVVTRCPMVSTQCPSSETQCPPVETLCRNSQATICPAVATACPPLSTRCPVIETQCPSAETQCPATETKCPPLQTQCPVISTECPAGATYCPAVYTQCPMTETECPVSLTKCPTTETRCPVVETKCPPLQTQCPVISTECPVGATYCPATETRCPVSETSCPVVYTKCPSDTTRCPAVTTRCPASETSCPVVYTKCPSDTTRCPAVETQCPTSETSCPVVYTKCPSEPTRCPETLTRCPSVETQCPTSVTKCPTSDTQCPVVSTRCPESETSCPVVYTKCPSEPTRCPVTLTRCPSVETQCPTSATKCPTSGTQCPVVSTQCPSVETRCPAVRTQCPTSSTQCPVVSTQCPSVETRCPPVRTKCPIDNCQVFTQASTHNIFGVAAPTLALHKRTQCPSISAPCPQVTWLLEQY
ncbi:GEVED domain-containing protein [Planctomycetota bacterium]